MRSTEFSAKATEPTKGHTVRAYDTELGQLRGLVLEMGGRVVEQAMDAVAALVEGNPNAAHQVIARERKIDYLELDVDESIFNIIARRQPTAVDLRLVLALSKAVGNLERAGDKAEEIAECALRIQGREACRDIGIFHHVTRLGKMSCCMMERAMDALARTDVDQALSVFADDSSLADEVSAAMRHLMSFVVEDPSLLSQVIDLLFAVKALERIANHAGNIAEQVVFVAKGRDVRYQSRENVIAALSKREG
jgi:phosphate transport system protein